MDLEKDKDLLSMLNEHRQRFRQNELEGVYPLEWNGISRQSDWSDEIFFTKFYAPAASELRKEVNIDNSVKIAKFFLSLYLGCTDIPQDLSLGDIYFSLLPSIRIGGKDVFDSQKATEEQVSPSLSTTKISSFQFFKHSLPEKSYNTPSGIIRFSAINIDKWFNKMVIAADDPPKKQHFINMVGFIMLNMLRLLRNEDESVDRHMPMGAYQSFSRMCKSSFYEIKEFPFPPPHSKFYEIFHSSLKMDFPSSKHILAILVQSFMVNKDNSVLNFLNAACLQHFHGHGIGAINWSSKLAEKTGVELDDVLSCFTWEDANLSVEKIRLFKSKDQPKSWPWSRLFDDAAYYSLSTAKNTRFCLVCAYAVIDDRGKIPRMPQFRKVSKFLFSAMAQRADYLLQLVQQKKDQK